MFSRDIAAQSACCGVPAFSYLTITMNYTKSIVSSLCMLSVLGASADLVAGFDMTVRDGKIKDQVSGDEYEVEGHFAPENVAGASGMALRFDGYTSRVNARLGNIFTTGTTQMTVSVWVALPCYPIIEIDKDTSEKTPIITCLDETAKTGFGFYVGFNGKYSFRTYFGGWPVEVEVNSPLPVYRWNNLVAVVDCEARSVLLYNNGELVGSGKSMGTVAVGNCDFYMGQGTASRMSGPFELMSFNGLIDDISLWNEAKSIEEIREWKPENEALLDIPASRFADELLRPRFHGMPAAGWTNECHGMIYSDGRYHLFFQKNADGPYMARLHWGHISSENLYDWREEKIALAPGETYDMKGCWSGCVFTDDVVTGGKPNIIYTAVDYVKAAIAQAAPESDALNNWVKSPANPIISGRPDGLSDDFRDPYFFRSGDDAYIIVGSSKNGIGTTTLHKYDPASSTWSNSGATFFTGKSAAQDGTFWEMPNITSMPGGKWLFTATPLGTAQGVRTLYWTGSISSDGTFVPDSYFSEPRLVEMNSRHGFGLLSPTIYNHDGKTIVLGIVPDKLPSADNWNLGWAHCYSLPREWSLASDGSLVQKPFEGLTGLRTDIKYSASSMDLSGSVDMTPVSGRAIELLGEFEVGTSTFGFKVFKNAGTEGLIYYNPAAGELVADFSNVPRLINDNGVYDGIYRCPLPVRPVSGSTLKLNVFIDHSIVDIFVNDTWATSIRVFPTQPDADGVEVYADGGPVKVTDLRAWVLDPSNTTGGIDDVVLNETSGDCPVDVFTVTGQQLKSKVALAEATVGLMPGLYIIGKKKVIVR